MLKDFVSKCSCVLVPDQVPLGEVQNVFSLISVPRLASVNLVIQPYVFTETSIPEDILGKQEALEITIQYPFDSTLNRSLSLQVDINAFRSTKDYTKKFIINMIDCTHLNLSFLSGFDKLTHLEFNYIDNIQRCLHSLPPLPLLHRLEVYYGKQMNELSKFPTLSNGLTEAHFCGDDDDAEYSVNDEGTDRIIDWLLLSSTNTLKEIAFFHMTKLTQVPRKISSFKVLTKLWLHGNNISTIKSGALSFSVPVSYLNIKQNGIKEIEPGAFQGNFKDAVVNVCDNALSRFDESVFGPMLQQMASGEGLITSSTGNEIDCGKKNICHLAWLWRYKPGSDFHLNCSNGTKFQDLLLSGFSHCS